MMRDDSDPWCKNLMINYRFISLFIFHSPLSVCVLANGEYRFLKGSNFRKERNGQIQLFGSRGGPNLTKNRRKKCSVINPREILVDAVFWIFSRSSLHQSREFIVVVSTKTRILSIFKRLRKKEARVYWEGQKIEKDRQSGNGGYNIHVCAYIYMYIHHAQRSLSSVGHRTIQIFSAIMKWEFEWVSFIYFFRECGKTRVIRAYQLQTIKRDAKKAIVYESLSFFLFSYRIVWFFRSYVFQIFFFCFLVFRTSSCHCSRRNKNTNK